MKVFCCFILGWQIPGYIIKGEDESEVSEGFKGIPSFGPFQCSRTRTSRTSSCQMKISRSTYVRKQETRNNFQAEVINEWFAQYSDIKKRSYDDLEFFQMKVFISKRSAWKLCRLMFEWYLHLFVGAEDAVIMLTNYHIEFPWAKSRARFPRNNSSYVNQVFKINFNGLRRMPGQGSCCKFLDIKRREARKIQCVPKWM